MNLQQDQTLCLLCGSPSVALCSMVVIMIWIQKKSTNILEVILEIWFGYLGMKLTVAQ